MMKKGVSTFICQDMSRKIYRNYRTQLLHNHNMLLIDGLHRNMVPRSKWLKMRIIKNYTKKDSRRFIYFLIISLLCTGNQQYQIVPLNNIGSKNLPPPKKLVSCKILYNYSHKNTDALIRYRGSNISLYYDTNAYFLVQLGSWSRYAGYFYLRNEPTPDPIKLKPNIIGTVIVVCKTLCGVLVSDS